jgi:hypothetical protein
MKRALEAFGLFVARAYLSALIAAVYAFPLIFVGGLLWLLDRVFVYAGLYHLLGGVVGSISYLALCFAVALFFSVYSWPHVREVIGKVIDQLGKAKP